MAILPDYLIEQTEDAIRERMLNLVPSDVDKSEGSFIWDSLSPAAFQLYMASGWAQEILKRGFATTTFGPYLRMRCEEHGVIPRAAVAATGSVKMTGIVGTVIPIDTLVATPADDVTATSSIEYETTAAATLNSQGEAIVPIKSLTAGTAGNVPIGAISILVNSITGVTSVLNMAATSGGTAEESDEALLARFLIKVRQPGTSGNKADYLQWALEIPAVSRAQVKPLWNGPGTVKVFILDTNQRAPSQTIVNAVQDHISPTSGLGEGKAPIGAVVTVSAAVEKPINISVQLTLASGAILSVVKASFQAELAAYLKQLAFVDSLVRYNRISAILLDIPSIVDFANLTINGGVSNIEALLGEVAVIGTVSISG
ncbi:baseplate J/gp47 family protein [Cohnella silvisoli]|uniref:Baseplate J/gp47 family protein n=1 Tax=Cohnella silvisoli TaxID=2873699 RepID=A0ABV1KM28_9BACL|nr:baseplate J/gp47 family protein [Cohnella silvisoli]MCD9020509.1 baseplate J/gp47 family protein [Cohnella silvisoli]